MPLVALLALVAALVLAAPAQAADPLVQISGAADSGGTHDTAIDADGTTHVVWSGGPLGDSDESIQYCKIPPGAVVCKPETRRSLMAGDSNIDGEARVFLPAPGRVVLALGVSQGNFSRFEVRTSADGGSTFSAAKKTGMDVGTGRDSLVFGPGETLSALTGEIGDVEFQRAPIGSSPGPAGFTMFDVNAGQQEIGLASTGTATVAAYLRDGGVIFRANTAGNANGPTTWSASAQVPGTQDAAKFVLASGAGMVALLTDNGTQTRIQRWTPGGGWTAPVVVPFDAGTSFSGAQQTHVDRTGVIHVAFTFTGPEPGTCYSSSVDGGQSFSAPITVSRSYPHESLRIAAVGAGQGRIYVQDINGVDGVKSHDLSPMSPNPCGLPPKVTTDPASAVTATTATLNGTILGQGQATTYRFDFGTTFSLGSSTAASPLGASAASTGIAGLAPDTTYYVRVVAINPTGVTEGDIVEFRTPKAPVTPGGGGQQVKPVKASQVLVLPKQGRKRCLSRRSFRIRVKKLAGVRYREVRVFVNGKSKKVVRGARDTANVDLKGLPKGRYTVRIVVTLTDGRKITATRKYRTCIKRRAGSGRGPL